MKILVTGSSGRIGTRVVAALGAAGHEVRGFDLNERRRVTLADPRAMAAAAAGVEVVVHLAALMSWSPDDSDELFATNVDGTRTCLEAAAGAGARRFVFASSGEVYPETAPETCPITERHPTRPSSPYGLTKLLGEQLVEYFGRAGTLECVTLRFSHTQDAAELLDEDSFFSGPRFFLRPRISQQERFGNQAVADLLRRHDPGQPAHVLTRDPDGRAARMHITDTRDMAAGIALAVEHPRAAGAVFNLGASEPVDFEPLLERMAAITGYPVVEVELPSPSVRFHTANERIRARLGFEPRWTIERMLGEAAQAWRTRQAQRPQ